MFQRLDIRASTRHGQGLLCAHVDVTGSESSQIMLCLKCENLAGALLKVGAEAYPSGFSKV